jgi:hypothetical protein
VASHRSKVETARESLSSVIGGAAPPAGRVLAFSCNAATRLSRAAIFAALFPAEDDEAVAPSDADVVVETAFAVSRAASLPSRPISKRLDARGCDAEAVPEELCCAWAPNDLSSSSAILLRLSITGDREPTAAEALAEEDDDADDAPGTAVGSPLPEDAAAASPFSPSSLPASPATPSVKPFQTPLLGSTGMAFEGLLASAAATARNSSSKADTSFANR